MNSHDDENQNVVYGVLFFVIALVLFLTMGMAIRSTHAKPSTKPLVTSLAASPGASVEEAIVFSERALTGEPLAKIYFAVGETSVGAQAQPELAKVLAALQAQSEAVALISGFHDETGSAQANAAVSKERAVSVRELLAAHGIAPERIQLTRPAVSLGGGAADEARRVEVRVLAPQ